MGSVRIVEYSSVGDSSSSVEYEFSEAQDFFEFQKQQRQTISDIFSVNISDHMHGENSPEDIAENMENVFRAAVKKKDKGGLH